MWRQPKPIVLETVSYTYGDDLISQAREGNSCFYHYDGLGSARTLSDSAGSISDAYDYEAFGEVLNRTGVTENSYMFAGEQFDSSLNQYYLRARYYDQGIGRFISMDTWGGNYTNPITLNKYLYAYSDPASFVDPSGYVGIASMMQTAGIIGTLTTLANIGVTGYTMHSAGSSQGQGGASANRPNAVVISGGYSFGSRGAMGEFGGDVVVDLRTGKAWLYGTVGAGLSPISVFRNFRSSGRTSSAGLIWNFGSPEQWSGLSVGASWPSRVFLRLARYGAFNSGQMAYTIRELARHEKNQRWNNVSVNFAQSTSGPSALRLSLRSNSFSSSVSWGSSPIEIPAAQYLSRARAYVNNFTSAINDF